MLLLYRVIEGKKKKKYQLEIALDFDKKSHMDITLMPSASVSSSNPFKEGIHLLVSDDTNNVNQMYTLSFLEYGNKTANQVQEEWKKFVEKIVLKSQRKKDAYREQAAKKKKKEKTKSDVSEQHPMIMEYRR